MVVSSPKGVHGNILGSPGGFTGTSKPPSIRPCVCSSFSTLEYFSIFWTNIVPAKEPAKRNFWRIFDVLTEILFHLSAKTLFFYSYLELPYGCVTKKSHEECKMFHVLIVTKFSLIFPC